MFDDSIGFSRFFLKKPSLYRDLISNYHFFQEMANIHNGKIMVDLTTKYEKIMLEKVKHIDKNMNVQNTIQFFVSTKTAALNEVNSMIFLRKILRFLKPDVF